MGNQWRRVQNRLMASVQDHYDHHLGPVYEWMIGDFDVAKEVARAEMRATGISAGAGRTAADLGAGPGASAIALAEAGFAVTAIDSCAEFVEQLRARRGDFDITCVHGDVLDLARHTDRALDVIVCLGDTLTHLDSPQSVERLFETVSAALRPGGVFVATFRDYERQPLEGVGRFIPVRQDAQRILTCFLEYQETTVMVHDLLHERSENGWTLRVSSYPKLRLSPQWARSTLNRLGLIATLGAGLRGMIRLVATRPA